MIRKQKNKKGRAKNHSIEKKRGMDEINKRILDNAPMSIITIDRSGYITSANRYFHNFSKTKDYRDHNIFKSIFFIRENLVEDYKKLLSKGTAVKKENCYEKNSKGEDKYFKIIAVPLRDKNKRIEGALSMAIDNTEAVLFKNELQKSNEDLELKIQQRTAKLDEVNQKLEKILELKSTLMGDISHELRTSLTIIQGNLELMASEFKINNTETEEFAQILKEIKRMSDMLTDLGLLTNSASSSQKLNYEKFFIDRMILSVCKSLKVIADENNIRIKLKKIKNGKKITADKSKLEKLIMNLIINAIKYNKRNGWVKILTEEKNNEITIKVEDGGIGIAKEHLPNIFERFYRVDKARTRSKGGSGLGLTICKWIAELHGGKIDVFSKINKGTTFIVKLPNTIKVPRPVP